jgi:hypothetical protein
MNSRRLSVAAAALGVVTLAFHAVPGRAWDEAAQPPGAEVQARGPVHEAFAMPVDAQPQQGPVVAKQPPDPIDEAPPEDKPDGDNVQWIPGYWAWDADQSDFLWVSGFWRATPPGRRWLPGHWQEIDGGWVWVSGFWAPGDLQEVQYLPSPPPSVDSGPSTPAPDTNSFYVSGCWVYRDSRYFWRPGHWVAYQPHWVWVPAHFVWTPTGYLFVDGYWDHPLDERGLLFAPVRFDLRLWLAARRPYVPVYVVHSDFLIGALFVGPHRRDYYFGDYFEDRYAKRGYVAWNDYHPHKAMDDPNFAYYRHLHAGEPTWENSLRELYRGRSSGDVPRPPHTLVQQNQVIQNITVNKTQNVVVNKNVNLTHVQNATALAPLKEVHNTRVTNLGALSPGKETKVVPRAVTIVPVPKAEHAREVKVATQIRDVAHQRRDTEAKILNQGGIPVKHTDPPKAVKIELPKPPPHVVTPPPVKKPPPPPPMIPKHEEHPIPKFEPKPPPAPPKKDKKP